MLQSFYSKQIEDMLSNGRLNYSGVYSIPLAASSTSLTLFTVPSRFNFFVDSILMINLTTAGSFTFQIGSSGQIAGSFAYYTNGTAANTVKSVSFAVQGTTRLWTLGGNDFTILYTNGSTAFTLKMLITGFLR